jgi:protein phosphatase
MMLLLSHACHSHPGPVHADNQDRWLALPERGLFIVADGMMDERAPQIAVDYLPGLLERHLCGGEAGDAVRQAIADLNSRVLEEGRRDADSPGLGTTVVLALVRGSQAVIAHLGDSRAYLWRAGRLEQLTRDHTRARRLLDAGQITAEDAARYRGGGGLAGYLGMHHPISPDVRLLDLLPADRLLLCSDGLHGVVDDEALAAILGQQVCPASTCRDLVAAALVADGRDNITALVVSVSELF